MSRSVATLVLFGSLVACASIVGLDASDPTAGPEDNSSSSSGGGSSSSASSSGSGKIEQDGITISPKELTAAFKCSENGTGTVSLVNDGAEDQDYEATLATTDVFTIASGAKGTVKAHDLAMIKLEAKSTKPGPYTVDMAVKTKSKIGTVTAKADIQGATLTITPVDANFGFVKENTTSPPIDAIFTNDGNLPLTISGFNGLADDFNLPSTVVIEPKTPKTVSLTMKGGVAGQQISSTVTPIVDKSLLCGVDPPAIRLTGKRTSDDVVLNPVAVDFSKVDCKTGAAAKVIKLSNFAVGGSASFTTTGGGGRFQISPPSGSVPKGDGTNPGTADITISMPDSGDKFGPITETLHVGVTGPTTRTYDVTVTMNVIGAEITLDPPDLGVLQNDETKSATIRNAGNSPLCVNFDATSRFTATAGTFGIFVNVQAGGSSSMKVNFKSDDSGDFPGKVQLLKGDQISCFGTAQATALCKPLPALIVSGHK